jgi:hypothetical protein
MRTHAILQVELWTNNEQRVTDLLYAGTNLDKARDMVSRFINKRPLAHLTIPQRLCVVSMSVVCRIFTMFIL